MFVGSGEYFDVQGGKGGGNFVPGDGYCGGGEGGTGGHPGGEGGYDGGDGRQSVSDGSYGHGSHFNVTEASSLLKYFKLNPGEGGNTENYLGGGGGGVLITCLEDGVILGDREPERGDGVGFGAGGNNPMKGLVLLEIPVSPP